MPARKPQALHTRHSTKSEIEERAAQEEMLQPGRALPVEPARFADHQVAGATWRRLMREFNSVEGVIVTRLDMDLMIDYCMVVEQLAEIDQMRGVAYETWLSISKKYKTMKNLGEDEEAVRMAIKVVGAFDAILKFDGRADRKRDLLLKMRQSLYLTPRARAGTAPKGKKEEPPMDPFEAMINDMSRKVKIGKSGVSDDDA